MMYDLSLLRELMGFILSRQTVRKKILYFLITIIFYTKLRQSFGKKIQNKDITTGEVADDIYPLF